MKPFILAFWFSLIVLFSYAQDDVLSCGVLDETLSAETLETMQALPRLMRAQAARKAANEELYVSRLLIEIDSDTYREFDRDTAVIRETVYRMIDRVSKVFEEETHTKLIVAKIVIHKDEATDPYRGETDIFSLLNLFATQFYREQEGKYDMGMYLPTKSFTGAGGVAGGRVNVSPWGNLLTIAHELGHCFGSPHTHSCSWPGGALDRCYASEGDCYSGALENKRTTIMSYCAREFTFHPLVRALIYHYSTRFLKQAAVPTLNENFLQDQAYDKPYLLLKPNVNALSYAYEIALDKDFTRVQRQGTAQYNVIYTEGLENDLDHYIRVKAINRKEEGEWSVIEKFTPKAEVPVPMIRNLQEISDTRWKDDTAIPMHIQGSAEEYEIQFYELQNAFGKSTALSSLRFTTNYFEVPLQLPYYTRNYLFRIRAEKGGKKSAWSNYHSVFRLPDLDNRFRVSHGQLRGGTLVDGPYTLVSEYLEVDATSKLTIAEDADFTKPIFVYEQQPEPYARNSFKSFVLKNLLPNRTYHVEVEISNAKNDYYRNIPKGVWLSIKGTFQTGENYLPSNVRIVSTSADSLLGGYLRGPLLRGEDFIYTVSERGLQQINPKDHGIKLFHSENTKHAISNLTMIGLDSLNRLFTVTPISSREGGYDGAFPVPVFSYTVWNEHTFNPIASYRFSFPDPTEQIIRIYGKSGIIGTTMGLYRFYGGNVHRIPLASYVDYRNIYLLEESEGILWVRSYGNDLYCGVKGFSRSGELLTILNTCSPLTFDGKGKVYYLQESNNRPSYYDIASKNTTALSPPGASRYVSFFTDPYGGLYLLLIRDKRFVFSYQEGEWKQVSSIIDFYDYPDPPIVDKMGRWWTSYSSYIAVTDPCHAVSRPVLRTVQVEGKSFLEAQGCTSAVWSWENGPERVEDLFKKGQDLVPVTHADYGGTYKVRCYQEGCVSEEVSLTIPSKYTLTLSIPQQVCQGQSLSFGTKYGTEFPAGANFVLEFQGANATYTRSFSSLQSAMSVDLDGLTPGKYQVLIKEHALTGASSAFQVLEIVPGPRVTILGEKAFCNSASPQVYEPQVQGGSAPFAFTWTFQGVAKPDAGTHFALSESGGIQVEVRDHFGCVAKSEVVEVRVYDVPEPVVVAKLQKDGRTALTVFQYPSYSYQWYFNGTPIDTARSSSLYVKEPGHYSVKMGNEGCSTVSAPHRLDLVLSSKAEQGLFVFPNPIEDRFLLTGKAEKGDEIDIIDSSGRVIWRQIVKKGGEIQQKIVSTTWPAGVYHLVTREGAQKLVKK